MKHYKTKKILNIFYNKFVENSICISKKNIQKVGKYGFFNILRPLHFIRYRLSSFGFAQDSRWQIFTFHFPTSLMNNLENINFLIFWNLYISFTIKHFGLYDNYHFKFPNKFIIHFFLKISNILFKNWYSILTWNFYSL